jgi:hypothetical protein
MDRQKGQGSRVPAQARCQVGTGVHMLRVVAFVAGAFANGADLGVMSMLGAACSQGPRVDRLPLRIP